MSKDKPKGHISNNTEEGVFHSCCGMPAMGPHLAGCQKAFGSYPLYPVQPYVPEGEIRVQQLVSIPWKSTGLVFALATDGNVYRQLKKGWVPVSMKIVKPNPADDRPAEEQDHTTKEF